MRHKHLPDLLIQDDHLVPPNEERRDQVPPDASVSTGNQYAHDSSYRRKRPMSSLFRRFAAPLRPVHAQTTQNSRPNPQEKFEA
jgi:hypothetical protein